MILNYAYSYVIRYLGTLHADNRYTVIHSPLKVDCFELLTDWSYIVRLMIDERTKCHVFND